MVYGPAFDEWKEWVREYAPVRSGTINRRYLKFGMWNEAHLFYITCVVLAACYQTFRNWCDWANIKRAKLDKYLCGICYDQRVLDKSGQPPSAEYLEHRQVVDWQTAYYHATVGNLKPGTIVIVFDFGKFHETTEWKLSCLSFVVLLPDEDKKTPSGVANPKKVTAHYYDYFGFGSQDYAFLDTALRQFRHDFDFSPYETAVFWADSGERSQPNVYCFSLFQDTFRSLDSQSISTAVELVYLAPHHGHSRADGHIGKIKQLLRQKCGGQLLRDPQVVLDVASSINSTNVKLLEVPVSKQLKFKGWTPGISKLLYFTFPEEGLVHAWSLYYSDPKPEPSKHDFEETAPSPKKGRKRVK